MPRSLLNIPGKDRKQRIWMAQFENGGYALTLSDLANALPAAEVFQLSTIRLLLPMQ